MFEFPVALTVGEKIGVYRNTQTSMANSDMWPTTKAAILMGYRVLRCIIAIRPMNVTGLRDLSPFNIEDTIMIASGSFLNSKLVPMARTTFQEYHRPKTKPGQRDKANAVSHYPWRWSVSGTTGTSLRRCFPWKDLSRAE
jgi:hypothetical protein